MPSQPTPRQALDILKRYNEMSMEQQRLAEEQAANAPSVEEMARLAQLKILRAQGAQTAAQDPELTPFGEMRTIFSEPHSQDFVARQLTGQQPPGIPGGAAGLGFGRFWERAGRGTAELGLVGAKQGLGVLQRYGIGQGSGQFPSIEAQLNALREREEADQVVWAALQREYPRATTTGSALGLLSSIALTEMFPWTKGVPRTAHTTRAQTARARMGHEALAGGIYGAATPTMTDEEKMMLIAGGAITGAVSAGLFTGAGRMFELTPDQLQQLSRFIELEKKLMQRGILSLAELRQSSSLKRIQAMLENIPFFGLTRNLRKQQFRDMARDFMHLMFPRAHGRLVGEGGEELIDGLSQKLFNQFQRNRQLVNNSYDEVGRWLDTVRGAAPEVRLTEYQRAARSLLKFERSLPENVRNPDIIRDAELIISGEANVQWKTAVATLKRLKESSRVENMKSLKNEVTRERYRELLIVEQSLWQDVENFATELAERTNKPAGQNILQALREADEQYKQLIMPFYATDEIGKMVTQAGDFSRDRIAAEFLGLSDPRGRARIMATRTASGKTRATGVARTDLLGGDAMAGDILAQTEEIWKSIDADDFARYIVVRESLSKASRTMGKGDMPGAMRIAPNEFRAALEGYADGWGVVFTKRQQELMEGYIDIVNAADRVFAKEGALAPLVGISAFVGGVGLAAYGGAEKSESPFLAGLGVLGTLWGAKFLLGSPMGHKYALKVRNAMVKAHDPTDLTNKYIRQALAETVTAFSRWAATQFPDMAYDVMTWEAQQSRSEQALLEQMRQSPYGQANPMTQSIMGAPPMMQQENE
jgi:hypothetical protein